MGLGRSVRVVGIVVFGTACVTSVEGGQAGQAADGVVQCTPGELRSHATIHSIGIEWDLDGDVDHDATCQVHYRVQGSEAWKLALPLFRVDFFGWYAQTKADRAYNMFAGSVLFLQPDTAYEVKLDLSDPDGGQESRTLVMAKLTCAMRGEVIMETAVVGRVLTEVMIENLEDLWRARSGELSTDQIRRVTVPDALVDTGATTLSLPSRLIQELGLQKRHTKRVTSSTGLAGADMYDPVRLTIQGRDCAVDVMEVPDDVTVLVGQTPLEILDLVVEPRSRRLTGNPQHGGEHVIELY